MFDIEYRNALRVFGTNVFHHLECPFGLLIFNLVLRLFMALIALGFILLFRRWTNGLCFDFRLIGIMLRSRLGTHSLSRINLMNRQFYVLKIICFSLYTHYHLLFTRYLLFLILLFWFLILSFWFVIFWLLIRNLLVIDS